MIGIFLKTGDANLRPLRTTLAAPFPTNFAIPFTATAAAGLATFLSVISVLLQQFRQTQRMPSL